MNNPNKSLDNNDFDITKGESKVFLTYFRKPRNRSIKDIQYKRSK